MAQVLAREYSCMTCHEPIRIAKIDNVPPGQKKKWERFELDGVTSHQCNKKQKVEDQEQEDQQEQPITVSNAELALQVSNLKETVNILISQIQSLRSDVKGQLTKNDR